MAACVEMRTGWELEVQISVSVNGDVAVCVWVCALVLCVGGWLRFLERMLALCGRISGCAGMGWMDKLCISCALFCVRCICAQWLLFVKFGFYLWYSGVVWLFSFCSVWRYPSKWPSFIWNDENNYWAKLPSKVFLIVPILSGKKSSLYPINKWQFIAA